MPRRMRSNWGIMTVLIFLVSVLTACTVPSIKFPKPEFSGMEGSSQMGETSSSRAMISAMREMAKVSDTEFVPPLLKLIEVSSSCNGCTELREPIRNSLRGSQRLYVELLRTEDAIRLSSPTTEKDRQIATAATALVKEMKVLVAFTLQSLSDADAYERSSEEWNLSQLSKKNDVSLQKTSRQLGEVRQQTIEAKAKYLAILN
ncbi:MAG: hypothetical protein NT108_02700 [Candidatus Kaiserbacteria bacterium]|nr:hypothetical protein [Candidatus Kaiserbacteria bacterium]